MSSIPLEPASPRLPSVLRSLLANKAGTLGLVILLLIVLAALAAPQLAPVDPLHRDLALKLLPPAWMDGGSNAHLLGTDSQGRDLLSRIVYGTRSSLTVGLATVVLSGAIGLAFGIAAGFAGGWIDAVIMRVIDAMLAIPTMLFMLVIALVAGSGILPLVCVIAATSWVSYARLVRAEVLRVKEMEFVGAARISGVSPARIVVRHLLPNVMSSFIVISALNVGSVILAESALSFLGFGIQPPQISWGQMLSDGRQYLATSWWVATFPGVAITLTVLSIILIGDWLRDYLDPRLS